MSGPVFDPDDRPTDAGENAGRRDDTPYTAPSAEEGRPSYAALPPPPSAAPTLATPARPPKSPGLALVLSLFPGLGQIYNGQPAKAFIFFFGWVACIYGAAEIGPFPFAFLIPFVYFYNLVDAWRSAALINARVLGGGPLPEEETFESPWWGGSLLVVGLILLLHNLGWLRLQAFADWWPLIMVAAGAAFLWASLRRRQAGR